jgi:hypothetical protein
MDDQPPSFARRMRLTPPPSAQRYGHDRARSRIKARTARRKLEASFDAAAAGALAETSAPSSERGVDARGDAADHTSAAGGVCPRTHLPTGPSPGSPSNPASAGAADLLAPFAAPASPAPSPPTTHAPEPRAVSAQAFAKLWASLAELRDGLGPLEEEKLIETVRTFLAGELPLAYWTRVINALAEAKRGADAAYGARCR